ncbi:hypothetical protein SAMN05216299_12212 [Nitrosospira sp. Nsp14]|nr:hypothetical protein SAMN05216299_12212 [Nitrosospira sp. Nsp14]
MDGGVARPSVDGDEFGVIVAAEIIIAAVLL